MVMEFLITMKGLFIYQKYKLSSDDYSETKKSYDGLKTRDTMLGSEINRLNTDTGIEEEIRSKFDVAKPGETVVTVINSSGSLPVNVGNSNGFWSNLWGMFK